jgi:hypothetical protein
MSFFTAVVLVCQLSTTPAGVCDESNAIDVISTHVESELGCSLGWQEIIARGALKEGLDKDLYVKTLCRRSLQASNETAK